MPNFPALTTLRACLAALLMLAAPVTAPYAQTPPQTAPSIAIEPYGWPWLLRALDRLRPSTDTSLPETSTQAVQRLENMIAQGQAESALAEIDQRLEQRRASALSGVDARLVFLRARALAVVGRLDEAREAYEAMTVQFPELPEPWNNLAAIYVAQQEPALAYEALQMAVRTNPDYAVAYANMGDVLLMLAMQAYDKAAQLGSADADELRQRTSKLLEQSLP